MAEASRPRMEEYRLEQDRGMAEVCPDYWHGHARIKIEESEELTREQKDFAKQLSERILDKKGKISAERVADVAIKKAKAKV